MIALDIGNIYKVFSHKKDMIKKSFALLLLTLVVFSVIVNIGVVSGATTYFGCLTECGEKNTPVGGSSYNGCVESCERTYSENSASTSLFSKAIRDNEYFSIFQKGKANNALGEFAKILILLLVIILIFSTFSYIGFPDNAGLRFLLAIIVGVLATILISNNEVLTMLQSFKALGITFTIFIPILILTFFSFVVAAKAGSFFGVMAQKIMWLIYSVYLFLTTATLLLKGLVDESSPGWKPFFDFMGVKVAETNNVILMILCAVSVMVFFIFVMNNKWFMHWVAGEKLDSDIDRVKENLKRSQALRKAEAESTRS